MTGNHHRILRQVLELDLATPLAAAPELQEQAARPFRERALPALEALFDRVAGPGRLLRLERLEVDLGELRGPDWAEQLVERLAERLRESLPEAIPLQPTWAGDSWGPEPPHTAEGGLEQLLFFLVHGRLPWWGARSTGTWHEGPAEALPAAQWRQLGDLLRHDPRARERLIQVAGDGFLAAAVMALAGLGGAEQVLHLIAPPESPESAPYRSWRRRFWTEVLELALAAPPAPGAGARLMARLLSGRTREGGPAPRTGRRADHATAEPPLLPQPWQTWCEAASTALRDDAPARVGQLAEARDLPAGPDVAEPGARRASADHAAASAPDHAGRRADEALPGLTPARPLPAPRAAAGLSSTAVLPEGEAVYLPGAGSVILHPFLTELFRSRGLLEGALFRDEAARHCAVHLLGHLTFGVEAPEHDLLLPKLLCGMEWEELLPPGDLGDDDRAACDELLAAVLRHWQALKSSSADWLRQQFFLREGRLERVDDGWKLTVEGRAQDVLLTRLPWGVGFVRLPWLRETLYVDWTQ